LSVRVSDVRMIIIWRRHRVIVRYSVVSTSILVVLGVSVVRASAGQDTAESLYLLVSVCSAND
jgi:hypothetical protein